MGMSGLILMENAGSRVVDFLSQTFAPLGAKRIVVICGKGNNGGDGFVIARQLHTRFRPLALDVVVPADPGEFSGDAAANFRMLEIVGCHVARGITPEMRSADVVVDALLGTGLSGPARDETIALIREINSGFPRAAIVAVDIPSGLASDAAQPVGESVRADYTITFTALKIGQVLPPNCDSAGKLHVVPIGSPAFLYEEDPSIWLALSEQRKFARLFEARKPGAHKGDFGHVLVMAGSRGKTGAAAMTGLGALRAGAGLVTVVSAASAIPVIAGHAPELMTEGLPETEEGTISLGSFEYGRFPEIIKSKDVVAIGPGLGTHHETVSLVRQVIEEYQQPMVIDADGLNALADYTWSRTDRVRVLTPHPGEMSRLTGKTPQEIQADRVNVARGFACERGVWLVLKGQRTIVALPDGRVWINPTGSPAMATGGTGDVLTGLIAGLLAQFPDDCEAALLAAVWLHGRCGELAAQAIGEKPLIATDLLQFLPDAMREARDAGA
jgi:NAD(P)H-hydrate epimerase